MRKRLLFIQIRSAIAADLIYVLFTFSKNNLTDALTFIIGAQIIESTNYGVLSKNLSTQTLVSLALVRSGSASWQAAAY